MSLADTPAPYLPRIAVSQERQRPAKVTKKVAIAIDAIVFDGATLQAAAQKAELTTHALRKAFALPHVLRHLKERRQVLLAIVNGKNVLRLAEIRDAENNMPAVNSIKGLEAMAMDERIARTGNVSTPGIVIQIVTENAAQVALPPITIDAAGVADDQ